MKHALLILLLLFMFACSSAKRSVASSTGKPAAPAPVTTGSVTVSWAAATGTVQGYKIDDSTDGITFSQVKTGISAAATSATVSGLPIGHTYYFRIRAFNQGGNSIYTSSVSVAL